MASVIVARQVHGRGQQQLDERGAQIATTVDRRVETYIEKAFGVRGLFAVEGRPTRRAYERYLAGQRIHERYPAGLTIGVAEVSEIAGRDAFVRRVDQDARASGLPYPPFVIRPNDQRPYSVVADYLHPVEGLEAGYGFDLMSEVARRTAVSRARDTARIAATAPVRFVTERENEQGVVVYVPIYGGDTQRPPWGTRSERFRGVAFAALRFPDLLDALVDPGEDLELYDIGSVDVVPARIRDGDQAFNLIGGADADARDPERSRLMPLTVAGRRWALYYRPESALVSATERALPWLIGVFGLIVSLLAGAFVQAMATSRSRAERIADERTEELRRSNEELERFAFLASHDLQQPLRTVSGFLQLLEREEGDRLGERGLLYLAQALRGSRQMGTLIDDLLAYSRVARDDRPLGPVPLEDAWDAAVEQLRGTIESAGATVRRGELPVVLGDRGQLVQVFANLIGNAVKYRGDAPPRVSADAEAADGFWEIAVQDNGIGIDPRDHARIFEMFRRLHADEEFEGTGVGLALARRIVQRSGGDIRVESERGTGSRFIVALPPAGGDLGRPA